MVSSNDAIWPYGPYDLRFPCREVEGMRYPSWVSGEGEGFCPVIRRCKMGVTPDPIIDHFSSETPRFRRSPIFGNPRMEVVHMPDIA